MILSENVYIKITPVNVNFYRNKKYSTNIGDLLLVSVNDLPPKSTVKVLVKCEVCDAEKELKFIFYKKNINRHGYYSCNGKCSVYKYRKTCKDKYGHDSYTKTDEFKNKIINTNTIKYGVNNVSKLPSVQYKVTKTRINNGNQININSKSDFKVYKLCVDNLTNKNKKELFKKWDGFDYYDKSYIKEYLNLNSNNPLYPSIDHKISIFYGYKNKIPPDIIGDINNLCITKRKINSTKNKKCEKDFIK